MGKSGCRSAEDRNGSEGEEDEMSYHEDGTSLCMLLIFVEFVRKNRIEGGRAACTRHRARFVTRNSDSCIPE